MIDRPKYLDKLIRKKDNGLIKIITGLRRCGKSYLLFQIYHQYLLEQGVKKSHIIELSLEDDENIAYRNPLLLGKYIRSRIKDEKKYYIILDEIQKVTPVENPFVPGGDKITFVDVLLGLMKLPNTDIYVTGSNSKMLSSEILTEFRGRGDEIRVYPLSFREFLSAHPEGYKNAWQEYLTYGGLPLVLSKQTHEDKVQYLMSQFDTIYLTDIVSRYSVEREKSVLDEILQFTASASGSLISSLKLSNVLKTERKCNVSDDTVSKYLEFCMNAFILYRVQRYTVKGKKYIASPYKYYFSDVGLRNALLNFRQQEENHIMENIIFNELLYRDFTVDVGNVEVNLKVNDKSVRKNLEIDFVANKGSQKYYIQSAFSVDNPDKMLQETESLRRVDDSFKKIVVVRDDVIPWHDENGILFVGVERFLLDEAVLDL